MITPDFTLEELLEEIGKEETTLDAGYYTSREWAKKLNIVHSRMMNLLKQAANQNKLLVVKQPRKSISGDLAIVPAYSFKT